MAISPVGNPAILSPGRVRDLRRTGLHPDHWYPLLRARRLKAGAAVGVSFGGEPIVLVRTTGGKAYALEDRCAHRQVPLSAGVVSGEHIQCCYHGWTYDCTGKCINIPYVGKSDAVPRGVRAYPCREDYGFVWVFPGDARKAEGAFFPDVPSWRIGCSRPSTLTVGGHREPVTGKLTSLVNS